MKSGLSFACLLAILTTLAGCNKAPLDIPETLVTDLQQSTTIIQMLIKDNHLASICEPGFDKAMLARLLKNYSPVHMAFESEVLRTTLPCIALFYDDNEQWPALRSELELIAQQYDDRVKFAIGSVNELPLVIDLCDIEDLPSAVLYDQAQEIARREPLEHLGDIAVMLDEYLAKQTR